MTSKLCPVLTGRGNVGLVYCKEGGCMAWDGAGCTLLPARADPGDNAAAEPVGKSRDADDGGQAVPVGAEASIPDGRAGTIPDGARTSHQSGEEPGETTPGRRGRKPSWPPEEEETIRYAPNAAEAVMLHRMAFPDSPRTDAAITSKWYACRSHTPPPNEGDGLTEEVLA